MSTTPIHARDLTTTQRRAGFVIIAILFGIFGAISWVNATLIPFFKDGFGLTHFKSYWVPAAFYSAYLVFSMPAAHLLKRTGFKQGMRIGFWVMAAGAFLFIPAALTRTYGIFLGGLFTLGTGLAILQTAANPYITILGPKESAARRIGIMGICNKGAGILATLALGSFIIRPSDAQLHASLALMGEAERTLILDGLFQRVVLPYAVVGGALFIFGLLVRHSPLPEIDTEHETAEVAESNADKTGILQFPQLILGAVGIFLHVGASVIAVDTISSYAKELGVTPDKANSFPSYTLTAMIIGYIMGILLIPRYVSQVTALRFCTILGALLSILVVTVSFPVSMLGHTADISLWFVVLLGFANSLTWAGIWPLALDGLGRFTKVGASVMIMGLFGNAVFPPAYGWLADHYHSVRSAYWIILPCYLYLTYYAMVGHKKRSW